MKNRYFTYHILTGYRVYNRSFFPHRLRMRDSYPVERAWTCRLVDRVSILCAYDGRTSPRAGHRAGPSRVRSRQTGTVAEEAEEKLGVALIKGPRSAESARFPLLERPSSELPTYAYVDADNLQAWTYSFKYCMDWLVCSTLRIGLRRGGCLSLLCFYRGCVLE